MAADCSKCAALCCVAPAFDESDDFAEDKPANTPCRHLAPDNLCTIHASLVEDGFPGCAMFDCHGAGQRVTQDLFGGADWRNDPDILEDMATAYRSALRTHKNLVLVVAALDLDLPDDMRPAVEDMVARGLGDELPDPDAFQAETEKLVLDLREIMT